MRCEREAALVDHYNRNSAYSSPASGLEFIQALIDFAGVRSLKRVLDVGCGDGRLGVILRYKYGALTNGIDISPVRVELAQQMGTGTYVCSDLYDCIIGRYDLVVFVHVLEHLEQPAHAVALARRCGPVVAAIPVNMPYKAHLQVYKDKEAVQGGLAPDRFLRLGDDFLCFWRSEENA